MIAADLPFAEIWLHDFEFISLTWRTPRCRLPGGARAALWTDAPAMARMSSAIGRHTGSTAMRCS